MSMKRPLSPHLQVYKPQITSVLSIIHRGTGVALSFGALLLAIYLVCLAGSAECFAYCQQFMASTCGKLALFIFSACLIYHLFNGIRHLFWDMGKGMAIETVVKTGYAVIGLTIIFTSFLWFIALQGAVL